ncbi:UNVERIFIED_CONTAM: hypothetical protein Scaly_3063600 [Sesamum calycinum]|uniref:Uncharacterized protein n=1 Tax=Sesamum calycinum TaxID=2727403 RepID=A0AAW2JZ44_9LAMI
MLENKMQFGRIFGTPSRTHEYSSSQYFPDVTTAIQSKPTKVSEAEDSDYHLMAVSEKKTPEDSLVSKLLRWLTASVILRKISCKLSKLNNNSFLERQNLDSLQSLLEYCEPGFGEDAGCDCEDFLAASIFYLLQMLGLSHTLLPTAVSALCLLLFSDPPQSQSFQSVLVFLCHCYVQRYTVLLKQILPGDGHITSRGGTYSWNSVRYRNWMKFMLVRDF